jgi:hypothetical protein
MILISFSLVANEKANMNIQRKPASGEFICTSVGVSSTFTNGIETVVNQICNTSKPFSVQRMGQELSGDKKNLDINIFFCCTSR